MKTTDPGGAAVSLDFGCLALPGDDETFSSRIAPSEAPTAHCHGQKYRAQMVRVVSAQFERVRVAQNQFHGLHTERASYKLAVSRVTGTNGRILLTAASPVALHSPWIRPATLQV